jgi:hypothetical protein
MHVSNREYFALRAAEEDRLATKASDSRVAAVHSAMAEAYRSRLKQRETQSH